MTPADIAASIMLFVHGMENGLINVQTQYLGVETLASVYYGKKKNNRDELLISGGILIARIQRQAKNVSADLQRESVTECSHCSPL